MNINLVIKEALSHGLKEIFNIEVATESIVLQETKKEFEGSVTFTTFTIIKQTKRSPEETGKILGEFLKVNTSIVSSYNVVKGFLNLCIADSVWINVFENILTQKDFGIYPLNSKKVIVEYSSPNTNKPLHLGHLRNNFLGYSVSEILKARGYEVFKVNLVNDRGIHICKSMLAYQLYGQEETPETAGTKGDHLIGKYYVLFDKKYKEEIADLIQKGQSEEEAKKNAPLIKKAQQLLLDWENGNKQVYDLWKKLNTWVYEGFNKTYKTIGVDFDKFYYESETYLLGKEIVKEGLQKKVFFKQEDNSVWVDLSEDGLDEKLLLRGDGTSVYITQDLGTAELKYKEYEAEASIYVVGNEQDYHFKVLKAILKKLGKSYSDGIYHLSYGMVDLPSGKMKSREGTVVDADDLIEEVVNAAETKTKELGKIDDFTEEEAKQLYKILGIGALKYFLLKVDPKKRMLFNPLESVELQGNTGPFIQYTYARICSIKRKADEIKLSWEIINFSNVDLHETERELIQLLNNIPVIIEQAAESFAPSVVAQYVYDLSKAYNRFYSEVSIFNEIVKTVVAFRISLSVQTGRNIKTSLRLLGIEVPERM